MKVRHTDICAKRTLLTWFDTWPAIELDITRTNGKFAQSMFVLKSFDGIFIWGCLHSFILLLMLCFAVGMAPLRIFSIWLIQHTAKGCVFSLTLCIAMPARTLTMASISLMALTLAFSMAMIVATIRCGTAACLTTASMCQHLCSFFPFAVVAGCFFVFFCLCCC